MLNLKTTKLSDVNLDQIQINNDGKSVELRFIDMFRGDPLAHFVCDGVAALNYHNIFFDYDGLPVYVGEVNVTSISPAEISSLLSRLGYQFRLDEAASYQSIEKWIWLHLESGEVAIDIVCTSIVEK